MFSRDCTHGKLLQSDTDFKSMYKAGTRWELMASEIEPPPSGPKAEAITSRLLRAQNN